MQNAKSKFSPMFRVALPQYTSFSESSCYTYMYVWVINRMIKCLSLDIFINSHLYTNHFIPILGVIAMMRHHVSPQMGK